MRAVQFDQCGDPQTVLQVRDIETPTPRTGQVLVRMLASPVNPSDVLYVKGQYTLVPKFPAGAGFEGVGVVESSGGGLLGRFLVGKRVAVLNKRGGNWAERCVVNAKQVIPLSASLTVDQAATFFVNPATAYVMTRRILNVQAGAWLLQTAAGSTLGRMVIRLGRKFGFKTLCVVRREDQVAELKQLGADAVIAFDPSRDPESKFVEQVLALTKGVGVPCAIECVGGATGSAVVRCMAPRGQMLVYGTLSGEPLVFSPRDLMTPGSSVSGFWLGHYMESLKLIAKLKLVRTITKLILEGVLASDIGERFTLDQVPAALAAAQQVGRSGKVLITLDP